jgi:signal transduction histidine kinase
VTVRDLGRGFDPAAVPAGRLGLTRSVRERMAQVDGRAVVESEPGRGTVVRLEWPR